MSSVGVEVATVWTSPDAPRPVDARAVADEPDVAAWTGALTREDRLGLHGRTLTQALLGEPVDVVGGRDGWLEVRLPRQPHAGPSGYPGWMRAAHVVDGEAQPVEPDPSADPVALARRLLGVGYLWGGLSRAGIDCSGLVHLSHRQAGLVVPRDARDQHAAAVPVAIEAAQPGDLLFFAGGDGPVSHVGYVMADAGGDRRMLHAAEGVGRVEETLLTSRRQADLVAAGRFLRP